MTTSNEIYRRFPIFILLCACLINPISSFAARPICTGDCVDTTPEPVTPLPTRTVVYNDHFWEEWNPQWWVWQPGYGDIGRTGSLSGATDKYEVTCPSKTMYLEAQVRDEPHPTSRNPLISIQLSKLSINPRGWLTSNTSVDTIDSDQNYSAPIRLSMRNGVYNLYIFKSGAGPENYSFRFRCGTSTVIDLRGELKPTIDQKIKDTSNSTAVFSPLNYTLTQ